MDSKSEISFKSQTNIDVSELKNILNKNSNHGLCGSKNLGNTCYMNSSIACLSNCEELTTFFLNKSYKKYLNTSNKNGLNGKLAKAWYSLLKEYWNTDKTSGTPKEIKSLVGEKYDKFKSFDQQDSQEFIVIFLELLSEDLNKIKTKKYSELEEQKDNETDFQCASRFWESFKLRNNSFITDLFYGLNKSIITCPVCKYKSITYNPFSSISLLIPNSKELNSIRYYNSNKDDIFIYYIPKFSIFFTFKFYLRIKKDNSFNDIVSLIKKYKNHTFKNFIYDIENYDLFLVRNKKLYKYINADEIYNNDNKSGFYFIVEKNIYKGKEMNFFPIYFKIGEKFSSYPRALYTYSNMTYGELKAKIYIIARQFINFDDSKIDTKYDLEKKMHKIKEKFNKCDEEELFSSIEKEYYEIIPKKKKIILPYRLLLQTDLDSEEFLVIFDGKDDNYKKLKKFQIESEKSNIDLLSEYLHDMKSILIININENAKSYNKDAGSKIDSCYVLESDDYCRKDYHKEDDINLYECLSLYNSEEKLEEGNEWKCKSCKNLVKASKRLEFFYLPKLLCICLSRFKKKGSSYKKNDTFVDFPIENLNMNKYIKWNSKENYIYDLYAISLHSGWTEGGHYTAYCKNYDGNWYYYDDSKCTKISEKEICNENAYVLFYRKRD